MPKVETKKFIINIDGSNLNGLKLISNLKQLEKENEKLKEKISDLQIEILEQDKKIRDLELNLESGEEQIAEFEDENLSLIKKLESIDSERYIEAEDYISDALMALKSYFEVVTPKKKKSKKKPKTRKTQK